MAASPVRSLAGRHPRERKVERFQDWTLLAALAMGAVGLGMLLLLFWL